MPFPTGARILDVRIGVDTIVEQLRPILDGSLKAGTDCFALKPRPPAPTYPVIARHVAEASTGKALELRRAFIGSRRRCALLDGVTPSTPTCIDPKTGRPAPDGFMFEVVGQSSGEPIMEYRPCSFGFDGASAYIKDLTSGATAECAGVARLELGGFTAIQKHTGGGSDLVRAIALLLAQENTCDKPSYEGRMIIRPAAYEAEGRVVFIPFWEVPVRSTRVVTTADTLLYRRQRFLHRPVVGCCTWRLRARFHTVGAFFFDGITGSLTETFANDSFFDEAQKASTVVPLASSSQTFTCLERVPQQHGQATLDTLLVTTRGRDLKETLRDLDERRNQGSTANRRSRAPSAKATEGRADSGGKRERRRAAKRRWYWRE